jgi:vacuolar-type H+-ATPase subunit I/STV1
MIPNENFNLQDFINMNRADAIKSFTDMLDKAEKKEKEKAYNAERAKDTKDLVYDIVSFIKKYFYDYISDVVELDEIVDEFLDLSDEEISEIFEQIITYLKTLQDLNAIADINNNNKEFNFTLFNTENKNTKKNESIKKPFANNSTATFKVTPKEDSMQILQKFFDKID